ncbi:putative UEV domain containing protein [Blattamonas nauphoetae]|uniref:UEV domain containing protein n=1 Tax=Blattamonas nauphoetae TaxID=2049346 RepID=A0ABQ9XWJ7_9EUKA|nr:putative UEV domain containing protein [Blattamonas nauphoetae]
MLVRSTMAYNQQPFDYVYANIPVVRTFENPKAVQAGVYYLKTNTQNTEYLLTTYQNDISHHCVTVNGLVGVVISGNTYNLPVRFVFHYTYPRTAPAVSVVPTADMQVSTSNPDVDANGVVTLPTLRYWTPQSQFDAMFNEMRLSFSQKSPLISKPQPKGFLDKAKQATDDLANRFGQATGLKKQTTPPFTPQSSQPTAGGTENIQLSQELDRRMLEDLQAYAKQKNSEYEQLQPARSAAERDSAALQKDIASLEQEDRALTESINAMNAQIPQMERWLNENPAMSPDVDIVQRAKPQDADLSNLFELRSSIDAFNQVTQELRGCHVNKEQLDSMMKNYRRLCDTNLKNARDFAILSQRRGDLIQFLS